MRVLSVVHDPAPNGGGGLFEELVSEGGHRLDRWVAPLGGPPAEPAEYDAMMVFGGVQHPDQDVQHEWIPEEVDYLARALEQAVPLLGVCLGSQLLARAAGGGVRPSTEAEVGWHPVELTDVGRDDPVLGRLPQRLHAFQWHYYTFDVPADGVTLATSPVATQAFRVGERAWGIQFHAEVTRQMLDEWLAGAESELPKPAAEVRAETDRRLGTWNGHGRTLCSAFLELAANA